MIELKKGGSIIITSSIAGLGGIPGNCQYQEMLCSVIITGTIVITKIYMCVPIMTVVDNGLTPYTSTKHSVYGMTKQMAIEAAPHKIRVNAVAPGV